MTIGTLVDELQQYINGDYCFIETPGELKDFYVYVEDNICYLSCAEEDVDSEKRNNIFDVKNLLAKLNNINPQYDVCLRLEYDYDKDVFIDNKNFHVQICSMSKLKCGCLSCDGYCCDFYCCDRCDSYEEPDYFDDNGEPIIEKEVTVVYFEPLVKGIR